METVEKFKLIHTLQLFQIYLYVAQWGSNFEAWNAESFKN